MMHPCNTSHNLEQQLLKALDVVVEKRPALETVIKPFAAILLKRIAVIDEIKDVVTAWDLRLVANRVAVGVPVVADISIDRLMVPLAKAFTGLLPALKSSFPNLNTDFSSVETALKHDFDIGRLAKAYMEGNWIAFESAAQDFQATVGALAFVVNWALSAVLNAARIEWGQPAGCVAWSKGYCSFCGSLPAIAYLSEPEGPTDEFLPYGGGQKYLYCALCGNHWRFERNRCPACNDRDKDSLVYYQESGEIAERFDTCRKCSRYLLCLDLRKSGPTPSMDLAAMGMVHLDYLAQTKGFTPLTWTPWNRIDAPLLNSKPQRQCH